MTSRDRILAAVAHRQSDKVPVDLGATPSSGISIVAHANLMHHLNFDVPTYGYDVIQQVAQPGEELLDRFGVDVLDLGRFFTGASGYWHGLELTPGYPALYPSWFRPIRRENGEWEALSGNGEVIARMPVGATFFDQTVFPYIDGYPDNYSGLEQAMGRVMWGGLGLTPWDAASQPEFWDRLRENALYAHQTSDRALVLGIGCNLFEWGTFLRRMDHFLMDLYLSPVETKKLINALIDRHMGVLEKVCRAVGDVVDIIKFGDDLGMNSGAFMPAETYREFFMPGHRMMCDYVRSHSRMITMIHSCGSIASLMPDMIEAGFEIFNPVQINAKDMDPVVLKREFGREITFWGGAVDTQSVLNSATPEQIRDHVRRNLEIFAKGGGYVFNAVHNIMPDVPPENIVAMFEAAAEF